MEQHGKICNIAEKVLQESTPGKLRDTCSTSPPVLPSVSIFPLPHEMKGDKGTTHVFHSVCDRKVLEFIWFKGQTNEDITCLGRPWRANRSHKTGSSGGHDNYHCPCRVSIQSYKLLFCIIGPGKCRTCASSFEVGWSERRHELIVGVM